VDASGAGTHDRHAKVFHMSSLYRSAEPGWRRWAAVAAAAGIATIVFTAAVLVVPESVRSPGPPACGR
jgi:hypothetical protein